MKRLTSSELDLLLESAGSFVGSEVNKVLLQDQILAIGFWQNSKKEALGLKWLVYVDSSPNPLLFFCDQLPYQFKTTKKPLSSFLQKYFVGTTLKSISRVQSLGRVVRFIFNSEADPLQIEFRLLPAGNNVLVLAKKKQVSLHPVKEIQPMKDGAITGGVSRNMLQLIKEWDDYWIKNSPSKKSSADQRRLNLESRRKKIQKSIRHVEEDLEQKSKQPWANVGEWLKSQQTLDVPQEWRQFVDTKRSLAWNIEFCFTKAKALNLKLIATQKRIVLLNEQLEKLESTPDAEHAKKVDDSSPKSDFGKLKIRCRKKTIDATGQMVAYLGLSAVDNLQLLRWAKPWYFWLHIKDQPSGHVIIRREKGQELSGVQWTDVGIWFCQQNMKPKPLSGDKVTLLIAESRFVLPVRGDRLGRVTYRNERIITVQIP